MKILSGQIHSPQISDIYCEVSEQEIVSFKFVWVCYPRFD